MRSWAEVSRIMFVGDVRTAMVSAEQRPCHARKPHQHAVCAISVRLVGVSGRAADTAADTLSALMDSKNPTTQRHATNQTKTQRNEQERRRHRHKQQKARSG